MSDEHSANADAGVKPDLKSYKCGTLTYTKAGLAALFAWLLWGDFCLTLMEAVVPSILPLKLKDLGCSNWLMGAILTTVPGILNMTICPYVSFKSDRYRSRWGRRIPFILWTMPFLCASLALLGWSDDICILLQDNSAYLRQYAPATVTIGLIAFFIAMFTFFNMFVCSVFWYLFNDIVPPKFLARFSGLFRIVGTLAGALYNYFVFPLAESNMREIFLGASVLYFIGFGMMCLMVKEGEYPPLVGEKKEDSRGIAGIRTFLRECFTHRFYWLIFSCTAVYAIGGGIGTFDIFFNREMGLSLEQIGKLGAFSGVAMMMAMYFSAIYVDRWHPMRITVYVSVFNIVAVFMGWVWVFVSLPGKYFFWLCLGGNLIAAFQTALFVVAGLPRQMRLFPQSRYGQFCSAQAMLRSFCAIGTGFAAGLFLDLIKWFCHGSDFAYRFNFLWSFVFYVAGTILSIYIYVHWYRMGGDREYRAPAPWSPNRFEEMPYVPTLGPQTKWMNVSFRLFNTIMFLSVAGIPSMMLWMYYCRAMVAFKWFGLVLLPLSLLEWWWWKRVERGISLDMERARQNEILRNGIPHHGMLIVAGIKFLLALILWGVQIVVTVNLNMETGAIVFGIGNVITNFMLVGIVWLMANVERGFSTKIDEKFIPATN